MNAETSEHAAFHAWLLDAALPLWAERGRDPDGAFYERLTAHGAPDVAAARRVRVQFRQVYVYAAAAFYGCHSDGADIAERAFHRVRAQAWAVDGKPGWAHLIGPDGVVVDATRDAYDQAFALLALAWLARVRPSRAVRDAIDETLAFVDAWIAARAGGWWESVGSDGSAATAPTLRRQNPHMHALEAMLALFEATGERSFLDRAGEIYHLFAARFFDRSTNVVLEYFDADWRPASPRRQRIEPGHMAEWVFLIREYERLTGDDVSAIADPLYARTLEIGLDPSGRFLVDELRLDGALSKRTRRLWPQTELLKATLCQYRVSGRQRLRDRAARLISDIRAEYLTGAPLGGWRDIFDIDGGPVGDGVPASTLYHLFPACLLSVDLLSRRGARPLSGARPAAAAPLEKRAVDGTPTITPVILAGGADARLWPLSTPTKPKQFLTLSGGRTLLQQTAFRVADAALFKPPVVVCHADHEALAAGQLAEAGIKVSEMILEPASRKSGPAIAAAAYRALADDPEALLLAAPADHLIRETALFTRLVDSAADAARSGSIVTFGITPTRAETAYGYIRIGAPIGVAGALEAAAFIEKPDAATARSYLNTGAYLWNSGMFLFRARDLVDDLARWRGDIASAVSAAVARALVGVGADGTATLRLDVSAFAGCPAESLDFALMERTDRAVVCPAPLSWSDVGGWDAIAMAEDGDTHDNVVFGAATLIDCDGVYVRADGLRVAAAGLSDAIIIAAGDVVLVTTKAKAHRAPDLAYQVALDCAKKGE